ncbi:predicted protein [Thalassiosira pseudonana CCMP1335]|uniref:Uncharacterized protein n=1 Tax=Thalassiosira pseudonana TaxID=35128 RepID=B8C2K0_THAPS|nr:predicted protein [Thalassiosira pseudonana CCMP1335]EED91961.1 predicted protein [Thalassiosira pseudonana CCMP1335]
MLDGVGGESKYIKRNVHSAATVTTDVWLHSSSISSFVGYDLVLALINVTGAFCDGFFSAWETGAAMPSGAKTEALHLIADDMRTYYLSTYTSWAGMVGVAASMAHLRSSALMGLFRAESSQITGPFHGGVDNRLKQRQSFGFLLLREINLSFQSSLQLWGRILETKLQISYLGYLLGLSLNIMQMRDGLWGDSLILRAFSINFCGAASLFARHASDNRQLYTKKPRRLKQVGLNIVVNLMFATLVFLIALEIERLLDIPVGTGVKVGPSGLGDEMQEDFALSVVEPVDVLADAIASETDGEEQ